MNSFIPKNDKELHNLKCSQTMKITIEHYDKKFTVEVSEDTTMSDLACVLYGLCVQTGYPPELVKEYISYDE